MNLEQARGTLAYQATLLGVVTLLTSGALALASKLTAPAIAAAEARDLRESLIQVLPIEHDNDLLSDVWSPPDTSTTQTVYRARRNGRVAAVVFRTRGTGYAGPIVVIMAVSRDGVLLGTRVLAHTETPGLGDKIEAAKSPWIRAFEGKSLGDPPRERWAVKKDGGDFDQFAGATITPRAVVRAITDGLDFFTAQRAALLDESAVAGGRP
ncbi:MAG: RnfABCDGE type electron transport complex subunit G [Thiotrichales bacterium]